MYENFYEYLWNWGIVRKNIFIFLVFSNTFPFDKHIFVIKISEYGLMHLLWLKWKWFQNSLKCNKNLTSLCFVFILLLLRPRCVGIISSSTSVLCYAKRSLMSWVVVKPKEGRVRVAAPALVLVWHRLFLFIYFSKKIFEFLFFYFYFISFFFWQVCVIPREGRARLRAPVLLSVWQWLRTLGTFSCDTTQIWLYSEAEAVIP